MVYIKSIECEGLYSYEKKFSAYFDNHTIIVGPNNSGKTNLFRIIKLFVDTVSSRRTLYSYEISHSVSTAYVKLDLQLTKNEIQHLIDYFNFYNNDQGHTLYYGLKHPDKLSPLLDEISIKLSWKRDIEDYGSTPIVEIYIKKLGIFLFNPIWHGSLVVSMSPYDDKSSHPQKRDFLLHEFLDKVAISRNPKDQCKKLFNKEKDSFFQTPSLRLDRNQNYPDNSLQLLSNLFYFCGYYQPMNFELHFLRILGIIISNGINYSNNSLSFDSTLLDKLKNFELQTSPGVFSDNTGTHPDYVFNKTLVSQAIKKSLEFTDVLNDDGSNLPQFLFSLRNSQISDKRKKFEQIKNVFDELFKSEHLSLDVILDYKRDVQDFVGDEGKQFPTTPKIIILDNDLDIQYPLQQVGSGLKEIIYLLSVSLGQTNSILMLDEPAVNLHPPVMQKLLRTIAKPEYENQIIIISHLPELVEFELFDSNATLLYVSKRNHSTFVRKLKGKDKTWFSQNRSKLKHIIDARIFFGKCIILTEGQTEKNLFGIMSFLENELSEFSTQDILVVNVDSMYNFRNYQRYLDAFGIMYMILADSNASSLFKRQSVGKIYPDKIQGKGKIFLVANGNIENLMEQLDKKLYDSIKNQFGDSKPTVAYEFAQKLYQKNPDKLSIFQKFFELAMKKIV